MERQYLDIDNCITISNADKIKNGKEKIKDKKHLAKKIADNIVENLPFALDNEINNIYMKLYRAERYGFLEKDNDLIEKIIEVLNVKESDLVKIMKS